jgi:hypothetical protein
MRQDCPECQRLWREYAAATTTHVDLEGKFRLTAPEPDSKSAGELSSRIASAATLRENTRRAIHQHETEAHGGVTGAGEIDG